MKSSVILAAVAGAASVYGHGYVYKLNIDNTIWPGYDLALDVGTNKSRITLPYIGEIPVQDMASSDIACGINASPTDFIAPARAGSNITLYWSPWVESHRGPLTNYLARYEGELSKNIPTTLKWFKVAEEGLVDNKIWATDRMLANRGAWTTTLPADIKPGTYLMRHELLALHFALPDSNYKIIPGSVMGPQFYVSCFNLNITGTGDVVPEGVSFPGAYQPADNGFLYNLFAKETEKKRYPIPGPAVYKSRVAIPPLEPKPLVVVSPTGDQKTDEVYYTKLNATLNRLGTIGGFFNSIGG